jgi:hypothetical protein
MTTTARTATAAAWTFTPTIADTFTSTSTYTLTPTTTFTPTITLTPTITPTPTFDFPKVTVNKTLAACLFGPAKAYLWARDLKEGDTGLVWGRAPVGDWLYVKMDRLDIPCWVSPYVVDIVGDVNTVTIQQVILPVTNALYHPPAEVEADRDGDQVTISWDQVNMTEDDDYGYFLDVWVCQNGDLVWTPTSMPNQYETEVTLTDEENCSEPSHGEIRTVEKHGYTDAVEIPWP